MEGQKVTRENNGNLSVALEVAIVGGGIAGLASAVALRRAGHTVFEQSRFLHEVGAAIHLAPNASRVLASFGLDPARAMGVENAWSHNGNGSTLEVNWSRSMDYIMKEFKSPWYMFHRVDLHDELKRLAFQDGPGTPAALKLGCRVASVDSDTTSLKMADGSAMQADLIIGADGVHSSVVRAVVDSTSKAEPTGQAAYRFLVPVSALLSDTETAWLVKDKPVTMYIFPIEDRRIACYPCRDYTLMNFVAIHPDVENPNAVEDWNVDASLDGLLNAYEMFHPSLKAILRKAQALNDLKLWKLLSRTPLERWVRGNVCVIGDAAHPMLPHSGQGGGQSVEDAAALGVLFRDLHSKADIPRRLQAFQELRYRRASAIQILSNHGQDQAHKSQEAARPYVTGHIPANQHEFHTYMYSYHILPEAETTLKQCQAAEAD